MKHLIKGEKKQRSENGSARALVGFFPAEDAPEDPRLPAPSPSDETAKARLGLGWVA